jgi:hypothetical protein
MRSSEEKPYILAFSPELVAEKLTLMEAVSVLAGRVWVGLFSDSTPNHSASSWTWELWYLGLIILTFSPGGIEESIALPLLWLHMVPGE